jgi:hypothetical protein
VNITRDNIDEATAAELQRYMEDHGVKTIQMRRERYPDKVIGWTLYARLVDGRQIVVGPFPGMSDAMKHLIFKLEEA